MAHENKVALVTGSNRGISVLKQPAVGEAGFNGHSQFAY